MSIFAAGCMNCLLSHAYHKALKRLLLWEYGPKLKTKCTPVKTFAVLKVSISTVRE